MIADDLELGFERYGACRGLSSDEAVWDGFDRACFVTLIAERLLSQDELSRCVRTAVAGYAACGAQKPCESRPCVSAVLLDDNPVEELFKEDCGNALDAETRARLIACR